MGRSKDAWADQIELEQRISYERAEAAYFALADLGLTEIAEKIRTGLDLKELTHGQLVELLGKLCTDTALAKALHQNPIQAMDITELSQRRRALNDFKCLLNDDQFFATRQQALGPNKRQEDVWQDFIQQNTWILGYGLSYVLNSPLEGRKLELVVKGHDIAGSGKRVDSLLKSRGLVSALSFGEIKTHNTPLLKPLVTPYRPAVWQISDDMSGGITQLHRSVQMSLANLKNKLEPKNDTGAPTGEQLLIFQPRSFLIIGSLSEFQAEKGLHEDKYASFELFRRNIVTPEIVTFDELYERARFIVEVGQ